MKTRSYLKKQILVQGQGDREYQTGGIHQVFRGFDEHDLLLAEAVASQLAVALQNVQLTKEAIRTERLASLYGPRKGLTTQDRLPVLLATKQDLE